MQRRISRRAINSLGFGLMGLFPFKVLSARSQSSSQSTAQDPDTASVQCLMEDDTQCAVDIWEEQFAREPYNDQTREALHLSLITHVIRSLDKGRPTQAREAFERAKELVPSAALYGYLQETLDSYDKLVGNTSMSGLSMSEFQEETDSSAESRYVKIPSVTGGQTTTFAITSKVPGQHSYYEFELWFLAGRRVAGDFAMRYLVFPMNSNGSVVTPFGIQGTNEYFSANITWSYGSSATWSITQHPGAVTSTFVGEGGYLTVEPNQWHWVEIRLRGSTVELWVDMALVGQQVVLQYEPGGIGFGVGLNAGETGTTFSAAFDDIAVYTLAD